MIQHHLLFVVPVIIGIILGTSSISPGDPFSNEIDDDDSETTISSSTAKYALNKTTKSSLKPLPLNKFISIENNSLENQSFSINVNKIFIDNITIISSTQKPVQETLPIYKKHLVQIAQWKYTEPRNNQTRYWYHTLGSTMGSGWMLDSILCQAYSRQKPDTIPIHAFHSETKSIWTNTLQTDSTILPIGNNQWKYDGVLFYAYKTSMNSSLLKPVWKYWNKINYGTEDVREPRRSYLRIGDLTDDDPPGWKFESLLFYAFLPDINVTQYQ